MKYKIAAAVVIISTLLLGACGSSSKSDTTTTPSLPRTTTTVQSFPTESDFVNVMRTRFPGASRSDLISLGKTACDLLDEVGSLSMAILVIATDPSWAGMEEDAGFTIGAAIPVFCPEYIPQLNALV